MGGAVSNHTPRQSGLRSRRADHQIYTSRANRCGTREVFRTLAEEKFFAGLQRREFSLRIAWLLSEINRVHPFREGNGRTQRQFVRQLCVGVGFKLHFEAVSRERLVQASILAAGGDLTMMERLTDEISDTERIQALAKLISHFEKHAFGWNDYYLATTTAGQSYTGTFAGSDGTDFFFYDTDNRILVGKTTDLTNIPEPGGPIAFTSS
jgi:cell filamentation protein, protein adenylyltransferase